MYLVQSGGQGIGSSQGAGLEQRIQQTLQGAGSALQQSLRSIQGKHMQQHLFSHDRPFVQGMIRWLPA